MGYSGARERLIQEKTRGKKSRDIVPLRVSSLILFQLFDTVVVDTDGKFASSVFDTVPVVHIDLRISPRIFEKNLK
jgi:hypothetical protein